MLEYFIQFLFLLAFLFLFKEWCKYCLAEERVKIASRKYKIKKDFSCPYCDKKGDFFILRGVSSGVYNDDNYTEKIVGCNSCGQILTIVCKKDEVEKCYEILNNKGENE